MTVDPLTLTTHLRTEAIPGDLPRACVKVTCAHCAAWIIVDHRYPGPVYQEWLDVGHRDGSCVAADGQLLPFPVRAT